MFNGFDLSSLATPRSNGMPASLQSPFDPSGRVGIINMSHKSPKKTMALHHRPFLLFVIGVLLLLLLAPLTLAEETTTSSQDEYVLKEAAVRIMSAFLEKHSTRQNTGEFENLKQDIYMLFGHVFEKDVLEEMIEQAVASTSNTHYSDRFFRDMLDVVQDSDCMEREFNVKDDKYNPEEAAQVFQKCKLLVLRNVFDAETFLNDYKVRFTTFINSIHEGRTSFDGKTSHGEPFYLKGRYPRRWEMVLPQGLVDERLVMNWNILNVLMSNGILGQQCVLHGLGAVMSEPGAGAPWWHVDEPYLFGDTSLETHGITGHDLPSYAVTAFIPMTNTTRAHGPTEFCMGSSALGDLEEYEVWNETLWEEPLIQEYLEAGMSCPPSHWRSPLLNFGDVVIFDYQLWHRAGRNDSNDIRAMVYLAYSREWYKDRNNLNRDYTGNAEQVLFQKLMNSAKLAVPHEMNLVCEKGTCESDAIRIEDMRDLFAKTGRPHAGFDYDPKEEIAFDVSNLNMGAVNLVINKGKPVSVLESGRTVQVYAKVGDRLEVRAAQGKEGVVYNSFTILPRQEQIILDRAGVSAVP